MSSFFPMKCEAGGSNIDDDEDKEGDDNDDDDDKGGEEEVREVTSLEDMLVTSYSRFPVNEWMSF